MLLNHFFKDAPKIDIEQLSCDSRLPMKNAIFFCIKGIRYNGHDFVKEAIKNGAKVVVYDQTIDTSHPAVFIRVPDVNDALVRISNIYYNNPSLAMETILVGGNLTRSIMAHCAKEIINKFQSCGYIGRYGISYNDNNYLSFVPALTLLHNQKTLYSMVQDGVKSCVFEMNSSAIHLRKLDGININAFVYVGTALDEREYADDEVGYGTAYRSFIASLDAADILINRDDPHFNRFSLASKKKIVSFGFHEESNYRAVDIEIKEEKTCFTIIYRQERYFVETPMLGFGAVIPSLASIALLAERGYPIDQTIRYLKDVHLPKGFEERVQEGQKYRVLIDKAPTLNECENILQYAKEITDAQHRLLVVEGIGTTMERRFRDGIASLLNKYADQVIITENDADDQDVMDLGIAFSKEMQDIKTVVIEDREDAIRAALDLLNENDTLLILGKGNEKRLYRSLGKEFYQGDSECVREYIRLHKEVDNEFSEVY